uniref:Transposase n=1 Tax=Arundo donax TaxID=35708 RepID=A0A0A9HF63_ARUDO
MVESINHMVRHNQCISYCKISSALRNWIKHRIKRIFLTHGEAHFSKCISFTPL